MNNRKMLFAGLIGFVFIFAGYNLFSYFKEQQAIQIEEDRLAQERRIARDAERAERAAKQADEAARQEEERQQRLARQEQEAADRQAKQDQERLEAEATARVAREAREEAQREAEKARLAERITRARSIAQIEDFSPEFVSRIRTLSPRYLEANPDDAFGVYNIPENARAYSNGYGKAILYRDQTTFLMVAAALSQNPELIDTVIGLGGDINATNKMGITPLMFAAAYNTPEMVKHIINQGADALVVSFLGDANALHLAAALNPNPDVINVLIEAGLAIESPMVDSDTALLVASKDNTNIEVIERLVELGADVGAFDEDGVTALGLVTQRLENRGARFNEISDELNERVLQALSL